MKWAWRAAIGLVLLATPLNAPGAEQVKLKYVHTVYADAEGVALRAPAGVDWTSDFVFVADTDNRRIVRYGYKDGTVTPDATFPVSKMVPLMVRSGPDGNLYVLDGRERKIFVLDPAGTIRGELKPKGVPGSQKVVPRSLRVDGEGTLYVLDIFGERVLVLKSDGTYVRHVAFPEGYGFFSDVAVDGQGRILILDSVDAVVYRAGKEDTAFAPLSGSLKENVNFPTGLAPDAVGNLFLVDQYGSGLAVLGTDGSFLGRKLGMGWSDSHLYYPTAIAISPTGDVFIADKGNNRVQQFVVVE